ncbi:MAG TPA: LuxR C-terminal-related transcriptional regulator [Solirubrobacteraceae bacterium]|nr:LuxR C-terminal-related transcriptional regulator [Solirubrobacteraceae bacterium]
MTVFAEGAVATADGLRWGWHAGVAASTLWDEATWHLVVERQVRSARQAGVLSDLPFYLQQLALTTTWRGDFAAAALLLAEVDAITEATGTRFGNATAVVLACFRGREGDAWPLIELETRNAAAAGHGLMTQMLQWTSGILHNGLGRYDEAVIELERASEPGPELGVTAWVLPELIEAASRTETIQLAGETLERLRRAATAGGDTDWGMGILARSSALLSEGQDAEDSYREAIVRLGRTRLAPELARAHLLYGEWLRRENRRLDAREQLRIAHEQFTSIGMEAFAERARAELQATGEHVRRHAVETRDDLTAQERQIAEMARDGLSNPEIGARLFLSPRTVEWHLRHVFTKLGIHSRRELAKALPSSSSETVPA